MYKEWCVYKKKKTKSISLSIFHSSCNVSSAQICAWRDWISCAETNRTSASKPRNRMFWFESDSACCRSSPFSTHFASTTSCSRFSSLCWFVVTTTFSESLCWSWCTESSCLIDCWCSWVLWAARCSAISARSLAISLSHDALTRSSDASFSFSNSIAAMRWASRRFVTSNVTLSCTSRISNFYIACNNWSLNWN